MTRIALIGSGYEWTILPVIRELGRIGHECFLFSNHFRNPAIHSKFLTQKFCIEEKLDIGTIKKLRNFCVRFGITDVICLDENLKHSLIMNQEHLMGLEFAFPPRISYDIAVKKNKSSAYVENLGIPIPKTTIVERTSDLDVFNKEFKRKLVVKGIRGVASNRIKYASNYKELLKYYHEIFNIEKSDDLANSNPIIQEYVGGPTYLTQGLAQHGNVKTVVPHEKIREWPISGGITTRAKTIEEPRLIEYTKKIMEALDWHGECGMEWKYDEERDDFYFLEMNPRFEGSVDIAIKAGVNFPRILLDIIHGSSVPDDLVYRSNVHYRFFFKQDFKSYLAKPYSVGRLLWDSIDPRVHGEIALDDLGVLKMFWKKPVKDILHFLQKDYT